MATQEIDDFTALAESPAVGDLFVLVDISDTTDSPQGTTKKNEARFGMGAQVNAQTGTTYTYLTTDFRKLVTHTNASPIAGTLPQAGASFPAGWFMLVQNRGAGALTITPTTSTVDGAAMLVLSQNEGAIVVSDGTNYFTFRGKATGAAGIGDVVGPGSATDNALARFDSTTGKLIQNSPVTVDDNGAVMVPEIAAPSTPASGKVVFYAKSDGLLYSKDDAGTETVVTGAGTTTEEVQDIVGALVIAGTGIDVDYNDAANTLTISNTDPGGAADSLLPAMTAPPTLTNWTWVNQGTGSATDCTVGNRAGIFMDSNNPAAPGANYRILKRSAPATPYVITAAVFIGFGKWQFNGAGVGWRQSSDGKFVIFEGTNGGSNTGDIRVYKWNSPTSASAAYRSRNTLISANSLMWFRIEDDGTDRKSYWSNDGANFVLFHSVGRTDFLTADEVMIGVNTESTTAGENAVLTVVSWAIT
jgi:hypothetical protein